MALLATTCTYDLVLAFIFMMSKLLTLEAPRWVGNIRLNRNAEVSWFYQGWDLRGIKCKYQGAGRSLLTISKDVDLPDTGHTLIFDSLEDFILCAWYKMTWPITHLQVSRLLNHQLWYLMSMKTWTLSSFTDCIGLSTSTSNCPDRSFLMCFAPPAIEWIAF